MLAYISYAENKDLAQFTLNEKLIISEIQGVKVIIFKLFYKYVFRNLVSEGF